MYGQRLHWVTVVTLTVILGALLSACGSPAATPVPEKATQPAPTAAPAEKVTITIWYWGGALEEVWKKYYADTIPLFEKEYPNVKVEAVVQTLDSLIQAAEAAQAAQSGPDILYYWVSGWFLKDMFSGVLTPLDDYMPEDVKHILPDFKAVASYEGKTYAISSRDTSAPWFYNKELFRKAGLDPEKPPTTWAEFLTVCEKLKQAGIIPIARGFKDAWALDWVWLSLQTGTLDTNADWMNAYLGTGEKMTDPRFTIPWARILELHQKGYFAPDAMSKTDMEGYMDYQAGKAAMVWCSFQEALEFHRSLGPENLGTFLSPTQGEGEMSKYLQVADDAWAIPAYSKHKREAANFLSFTLRPERLKALWDITQIVVADDRYDPAFITNAAYRDAFEKRLAGDSRYSCWYIGPPVFGDWDYVWGQKLLTGEATVQQVAEAGEKIFSDWRQSDPQMVENYKKWAKGIK